MDSPQAVGPKEACRSTRNGRTLTLSGHRLADDVVRPAVERQRRGWESNPLETVLQTVARPSGTCVIIKLQRACPRQELNLVLDLRRVVCHPSHSEDADLRQSPTRESNPALRFRRPPCLHHTRREFLQKQGREDLNPIGEIWRLAALPGAHPCRERFRPLPAMARASRNATSLRPCVLAWSTKASTRVARASSSDAFQPDRACDRLFVRYTKHTPPHSWSSLKDLHEIAAKRGRS
jgi:hypothetical protein